MWTTPINLQPFYDQSNLQNSVNFYQNCLSLSLYADLTKREQIKVIECLKND